MQSGGVQQCWQALASRPELHFVGVIRGLQAPPLRPVFDSARRVRFNLVPKERKERTRAGNLSSGPLTLRPHTHANPQPTHIELRAAPSDRRLPAASTSS